MSCKKHRRCNPQCPPRRADGSYVTSLSSLCLLCWNTGCVIPTGNGPSIDKWIEMHNTKITSPTRRKAVRDGAR